MLNVGFAAVALLIVGGSSDDWTEFRGPGGQGHAETALPVSWSESENIVWKQPIPGIGWSSPVVRGNAIYVTTAVGDDELRGPQSLRVIRLAADSGEQQWDREVFAIRDRMRIHNKNSHASPTPIVQGDRIYVHFGTAGTACISEAGETIWKTKLDYAPVHGSGGSPAIAGDILLVCCDGGDKQFVAGLNKNTGEVVWQTDRDSDATKGFSFCTPLVIEAGGRTQAVCPGSGEVVAYDPQTGRELWSVDYDQGYSVVPRPVFAHGLVYVCSGYDRASLFAIDPTGSGDVTDSHVKWTLTSGIPLSPSLLVVGDELYFVSDRGVARCVDARTGEEIWKERLGGKFSASPLYAGGHVYFQDEKGTTTVVRSGREFVLVAKNKLGDGQERTYASFATVADSILYRSENHLYRISD